MTIDHPGASEALVGHSPVTHVLYFAAHVVVTPRTEHTELPVWGQTHFTRFQQGPNSLFPVDQVGLELE